MPLFKFNGNLSSPPDTPGWKNPPYSSRAQEWAQVGGPCEQWESWLKEAKPLDVLNYMKRIPIGKGKEITNSSKRGWILLTAYRKQHQSKERLLLERSQME